MAPALIEDLAKRRYCTYGAWGGQQCFGGSRWHRWGRWLLLALVLFVALLALISWFGGSMIRKRRQRAQNQSYPQQQQYEQQETYPQNQNNYANAGPPSGPPPQEYQNQGYYDAADSKQHQLNNQQGDYGPPPGPPPVAYQTHP